TAWPWPGSPRNRDELHDGALRPVPAPESTRPGRRGEPAAATRSLFVTGGRGRAVKVGRPGKGGARPSGGGRPGGARSALLEAFQHVHCIDADLVDGVAALHDEQRRRADPRDRLADAQIVVVAQFEPGDRVLLE